MSECVCSSLSVIWVSLCIAEWCVCMSFVIICSAPHLFFLWATDWNSFTSGALRAKTNAHYLGSLARLPQLFVPLVNLQVTFSSAIPCTLPHHLLSLRLLSVCTTKTGQTIMKSVYLPTRSQKCGWDDNSAVQNVSKSSNHKIKCASMINKHSLHIIWLSFINKISSIFDSTL